MSLTICFTSDHRLDVPTTHSWPQSEAEKPGCSARSSPRVGGHVGRDHPATAHSSPRSRSLPTTPHQATYTGYLIQQELNSRASLSPHRVRVLESAISFLNNHVTSSQPANDPESESVPGDTTLAMEKIPPELLYVMFVGRICTFMIYHATLAD